MSLFTSADLVKSCQNVYGELNKLKIKDSQLIINLESTDFEKLEEDIFYRFFKKDENTVYVPSEEKFSLKISDNLTLIVKRKI